MCSWSLSLALVVPAGCGLALWFPPRLHNQSGTKSWVMPPRKRAREDAGEAAATQELQRTKSAVDEAFAELVCPITQALPLDPVTAEDGKVYERSAIAEWLEKHQRSPLTNEPMGTRLFPAVQVKSMIRTMVKSGAITGDKAEAWQTRLADDARVEEWRTRAAAGDGVAMRQLGISYAFGLCSVDKDLAKGFEWFQKSDDAGDAGGTAGLGVCYLLGNGVAANMALAVTHLTRAAEQGSKRAAYELADCFTAGVHGFPKDAKEARRWYTKVASGSINDLTDEYIGKAAAWLRDHPT